jgi:GTP cyclohydrolase I
MGPEDEAMSETINQLMNQFHPGDDRDPKELFDVQHTSDDRGIEIDQVGICDLVYPVTILDRIGGRQSVTSRISISVSLPHHFKGTHMSRFLEVLASHREVITLDRLPLILGELKERLLAQSAHIEIEFDYFMIRKAPVSGMEAPMDYHCAFIGGVNGEGEDLALRVTVPVATLCPCSKSISDYGAHNQRGYVTMEVRAKEFVWIEELVTVAEESASAPIYPLLKRVDERHVTMQAYDNPVFVEDVVRNVAVKLREDKRIFAFKVRAENHESIHNHSAFAVVSESRMQW